MKLSDRLIFGIENGAELANSNASETLSALREYESERAAFREQRAADADSLRRSVELFELSKRERPISEGKIVLSELYKSYLREKDRFKENIKALRISEIECARAAASPSERARFDVEKAYIGALPHFERLRNALFHGWFNVCNAAPNALLERHYFDRAFFRRERPSARGDGAERFELRIRVEQERRRRQKQRQFFATLCQSKTEFDEFHRRRLRALRKIAAGAKLFAEASRKREEQELTLDEKQRRKALEEHNYEEYQEMVQRAKDQRITKILEDTDRFLLEVAAKVRESKGSAVAAPALVAETGEYDFSRSALLQKNYEELYYNFTHAVADSITEQPTLLEGGRLKGYQMQGLRWLASLYANKLNGILADEMGLGKTIQTISLLCYLMESKQNPGPFLIVVPLSTLSNWRAEFDRWAPSVKKIVYRGTPLERRDAARKLREKAFNVCVTTYEYVLKDRSELSRYHWQYIIVDEGHKMKNPKSKFGYVLGHQYTSEFRVLLTGTPLQNNLSELWSLLNFLLPRVFTSCDDFEKWFKITRKRTGGERETELTEEEKLLIARRFHLVLRPFLLRRIKREVEAELPQKLEFIVKVDLSAWQKIVYNQIFARENAAVLGNAGAASHQMMNNMVMQLRKICNHPYLFLPEQPPGPELVFSAGKFELLDRILPKLVRGGHRMLIFTQMTRVIDLLEDFMVMRGFRYLRLDGNTKHEDRATQMHLFNAEASEFSIFLLSTRAGGLGLNLQTADTVILFDSDWNPQMDQQAQDRAHRIGTRREVRVYRLVSHNTIEERILSKAGYKKSLDEMVIQAGLYNNRATDRDRRLHLEEIIKKQSLERPEESEVPTDDELNKILARGDEEMALFQELDRQRYEQERELYPDADQSTSYRLMTLDDLPTWLRASCEAAEAVAVSEEPAPRRRAALIDPARLRDETSLDEEDERAERERRRRTRERARNRETRTESEKVFFESEESDEID